MASSFSAAWLRGDPRALEFLPERYRHRSARVDTANTASTRALFPALHAALVAQNARLAPSAARERHLELLARPGTTVVVTGQQVGLVLGPLYTVYKAASAIVTARALAEETGRPCVPLFWLQTEDHDLPEIDHTFLPGATGRLVRVALEVPDAARSRIPVAHRTLGASVTSALATLRAELGDLAHADEHLGLLERAYRPEATLADAFAEVLSTLFADEGLVFLDPRDPRLAPLGAPVHRKALEDAKPLSQKLATWVDALTHQGFAEQVHIRPGSPLGFVSPEGPEGARYRLDPTEAPDTWSLVGHPDGARVTTAQLQAWLEREPTRFTTSALLRPILQDTLLPTAAYVGGPGEIAYFAQMAPLYAHFGLPPPLVIPRARFRVLDDSVLRLLGKLQLSADEVSVPADTLLTRLVARDSGEAFPPPEAVEAQLLGTFAAELARLGERTASFEPGFARALTRTDQTVRRGISRLVARYGRVLAQRDEVTRERIARVQAQLFPNGVPQERVHGLPSYASRLGGRAFTRRVLEACEPFSGDQKDLRT